MTEHFRSQRDYLDIVGRTEEEYRTEECAALDEMDPSGKAAYETFQREFPELGKGRWEELPPETRNSFRKIARAARSVCRHKKFVDGTCGEMLCDNYASKRRP